MTKKEILERHKKSFDAFAEYIASLNEEDFKYSHLSEKWDAGQQLDHIYRVINELSKACSIPKFLLKIKFGKSNRPSKTFDGVVDKYSKGIEAGFKANGKFIPETLGFSNRATALDKVNKKARLLEKKIANYSELDLDTMILPHPAMGIMTMREIVFFSIHHVEDHLSQIKRNLSWRTS